MARPLSQPKATPISNAGGLQWGGDPSSHGSGARTTKEIPHVIFVVA